MESKISATELARQLGHILGRVRFRRDVFVVERNGQPVARLVPLPRSIGHQPTGRTRGLGGRKASGRALRRRSRARQSRGSSADQPVGLVIDTSALVALERAGKDPEATLGDLGDELPVIPAIVYAELLVGVQLADSPARAARRLARVDALIARCPLIEFDGAIANRWAQTFAALSRQGRMIPANDPRGRSDRFVSGVRSDRRPERRDPLSPGSGASVRTPDAMRR